jgi:hypothetical protein
MNVKKKSQIQEKRVAKEINGQPTIASGAIWTQKADARADLFLCECKTTDKAYYPLQVKTWLKIEKEALKDSIRTPIMCIDLRGGKNKIAVVRYLDLISLDIPDHVQFLGNAQPEIIENKSYRITPDFTYQLANYDTRMYIKRHDFKFVGVNDHQRATRSIHLVMLEWDDFLRLSKED